MKFKKPITNKYGKIKKNKRFCAECGSKKNLTIHHIKSKYLKGTNERNNLMVLCKDCHKKIHDDEENLEFHWLSI